MKMIRYPMMLMLYTIWGLMSSEPALGLRGVSAQWSYTDASSRQELSGEKLVDVPGSDDLSTTSVSVSHPKVLLSFVAADLGDAIKAALEDAFGVCDDRLDGGVDPLNCKPKTMIAARLRDRIERAERLHGGALPASLQKAVDLAFKLAKNIETSALQIYIEPEVYRFAPKATLNVTTGGVQNWGHFRKMVREGNVPRPDQFSVEAMLKEFDLNTDGYMPCQALVCFNPEWAFDPAGKRLLVQVAMSSSLREEDFRRKPLNMSLVIDRSGSMDALDGTHQNRLDWVKEAVIHTVAELRPGDYLSVVAFNEESQVVVMPKAGEDFSSEDATTIDQIVPRGATNLAEGLLHGMSLVAQNYSPSYENRVILLSDAGANTGETSPERLAKEMRSFGPNRIHLSVFGIGLDFNSHLVQVLSEQRGNNYYFVQSGGEMMEYFRAFDFLVTPVAFDVAAQVTPVGFDDFEFVKAYGSGNADTPMLKAKTLFFSKERGGAVLFLYRAKEHHWPSMQ